MSNLSSPRAELRDERGFSYEHWREQFLTIVLRGSCFVGFVAIVLYLLLPSTVTHKILAVLVYGILLLTTLLVNLPYLVRAGIFLALLYFSGLTALFDHGIADAAILFVGFAAATGLLFSSRTSIYYGIGITLLTLLALGWINSSLADWGRVIAMFIVASTIIGIGIHTFQQEFIKTRVTAQQTLDQLRTERSSLEQRVEERTSILVQKTDQLRATSYIARKTAEVQDLASLLDTVTKLVTDQFGFYHTGIFLINETGDQAVLQAASSEGGKRMIQRGHSLAVGIQGIVGYVAAQKRPRIAVDVGVDAIYFDNEDLPMTRSELALPLLIRNKVLGVLDIQSEKQEAFNIDDIDVLQTLADQIAVAIENARLLDETQTAIMQLEALTSVRTRDTWSKKLSGKKHVFTYTPVGLRAEKLPQNSDKAISTPIILRGQKIGDISLERKGDSAWTRSDQDLMEEVASQVGLAIENLRLLEEATQRARQEQIVGKLAAQFSQSLDLDTLLQTAARELGQLPDISEVSVFIGHEADQTSQTRHRSKRSVS